MIILSIIGAFLLGFSLGRNNLSNLFGTALGTRMIHFKTAVIFAIVFIFIGALASGSATTENILQLSALKTPWDIIVVILSTTLIMNTLSRLGIPASIVQTMLGSIIGWNFYHQTGWDTSFIRQLISGWLFAPFLAAGCCWGLMHLARFLLHAHPVSLFARDRIIRLGLIGIGILASYTLGANNIGIITAPYMKIYPSFSSLGITIGICSAVGIGFTFANKRVIETIGTRLFPLSPLEGLIVMLAATLSMACFSLQGLQDLLVRCRLPAFPLVPIPISTVMIGAICGISLSKGGYGLRFSVLGHIILSWFLVPLAGACLCFGLLSIGEVFQ